MELEDKEKALLGPALYLLLIRARTISYWAAYLAAYIVDAFVLNPVMAFVTKTEKGRAVDRKKKVTIDSKKEHITDEQYLESCREIFGENAEYVMNNCEMDEPSEDLQRFLDHIETPEGMDELYKEIKQSREQRRRRIENFRRKN